MAKGALITAAMVASLGAFLYPKLEFAVSAPHFVLINHSRKLTEFDLIKGAFRTVVPVNNEHCSLVPGSSFLPSTSHVLLPN